MTGARHRFCRHSNLVPHARIKPGRPQPATCSPLMTPLLVPATLAFRDDGTPYSPLFDDIYHSASGAFAQARHVFIGGNALPRRWQGRRLFTILETGFGIGGNFLATWAAWRADPARSERLAFVSLEKHPFSAADLRVLHARLVADATIAPLAAELAVAWPPLIGGVHRLSFDSGRVTLTIAFGDALDWLPKLWLRADALYLDGFAPAKNPDMWAPPLFKALAHLAGADATLATYTCAGNVRRGLEAAGFVCAKAPGFAGKRDMLVGHFAPRWRIRRHEPPTPLSVSQRHAVVIGAGIAGCALVERLAARGWHVTLLDRSMRTASEASGNPAGVFHPLLSRDESVATRISRSGFLLALRAWRALESRGHDFARTDQGLLQLPADEEEARSLADAIDRYRYPGTFVHAVSSSEVGDIAGVALPRGGCFYPQGGSLSPASLCASLCAEAGAALTWRAGAEVSRIERVGSEWNVLDESGRVLARAEVVVFANAHEAAGIAGLRHAPTRIVRGQLTRLPVGVGTELRVPLIGEGYAVPLTDGLLAGASYGLDDADRSPRERDTAENLERLARLVPSWAEALTRLDARNLASRVAFRCVTSDRLPMIGPIADEASCLHDARALAGAWPLDLHRSPGLYGAFAFGSRGLVWSTLAAELIASQLEGEPWPIERELAEDIDPARYFLRALRRGSVTPA